MDKPIELICGCCGTYFITWEGYIDQDQDKGFGICKSCQQWMGKLYDKEMDKAIELMKEALNEDNSKKFSKMSRKNQETIIFKAIEENILTFEFKNRK